MPLELNLLSLFFFTSSPFSLSYPLHSSFFSFLIKRRRLIGRKTVTKVKKTSYRHCVWRLLCSWEEEEGGGGGSVGREVNVLPPAVLNREMISGGNVGREWETLYIREVMVVVVSLYLLLEALGAISIRQVCHTGNYGWRRWSSFLPRLCPSVIPSLSGSPRVL